MRHELPKTITSRSDAAQLWLHLLERGISFHWEDDPADWVNVDSGERTLSNDEAARVSRAFAEVAALDDLSVYDDAVLLLRLCLLLGVDLVVNNAAPGQLDNSLRSLRALDARAGTNRRHR